MGRGGVEGGGGGGVVVPHLDTHSVYELDKQ